MKLKIPVICVTSDFFILGKIRIHELYTKQMDDVSIMEVAKHSKLTVGRNTLKTILGTLFYRTSFLNSWVLRIAKTT